MRAELVTPSSESPKWPLNLEILKKDLTGGKGRAGGEATVLFCFVGMVVINQCWLDFYQICG